jgi:hypothetical protein
MAAGAVLAAAAVGGNLLVYSSLDDAEPVVQVVRDVAAGEQLTADMFRTVDADVDATVNVVAGDRLPGLVGSYARVRLVSGALVTAEAIQLRPLVEPGNAVVAIQVPAGSLPVGLRERSRVDLVLPPAADGPIVSVTGRVVGLPVRSDTAVGTESISVELASSDAVAVAAADDVRVVLREPAADPAAARTDDDGGGS